jgi:hypothetical protein
MELSRSREAASCEATQEIPCRFSPFETLLSLIFNELEAEVMLMYAL